MGLNSILIGPTKQTESKKTDELRKIDNPTGKPGKKTKTSSGSRKKLTIPENGQTLKLKR